MRPMTILQALSETRPKYLIEAQETSKANKLLNRKPLLESILTTVLVITVFFVCKAKNSQGNLTL